MPEVIKILIVEDTDTDIQSYQDSIRTVNSELGTDLQVEGVFKDTKDAGIAALRDTQLEFSGAFIDLKLTQGEPHLNEGNDVVAEIHGKLRFPVRVLTNTPGEITPGLKRSLFFKVEEKTNIQYVDVINELVGIYKTGIINILGRVGRIESMLNDIFWNNISLSLDEWIGIKNSEKHLLRYALTHLQENLEISDDGDEFIEVYPIENYIIPSIKKYFYTGDIINKKSEKEKRYVILTPACDLAPHGEKHLPKASHVLLAMIENYEDTPLKSYIKKAKRTTETEQDKENKRIAEDAISRLIKNNGDLKYYYLPDSSIVKGGMINFQKLSSIKASELGDYEKVATIASQFIKDLIAKFSYYYSRQGSPDFNYDEILQKHLR